MLRKCLQRKRGLPIVLLGLFIAALGILIVASVARNRELQSPWYMQRSATILFESPVSPKELYSSLHDAFHEGSVNGYALIADIDVSGGISLGGLEGDLWNPVDSEDGRFSTHENIFWIHQQAVPEAYFYDLGALKATVNGIWHHSTCQHLFLPFSDAIHSSKVSTPFRYSRSTPKVSNRAGLFYYPFAILKKYCIGPHNSPPFHRMHHDSASHHALFVPSSKIRLV